MPHFKIVLNNHSDIMIEADQCDLTAAGDLVLYRHASEARVHQAFARGIWLSLKQQAGPEILAEQEAERDAHLNAIQLDTLEMSTRAYNAMKMDNINTIGDLRKLSREDLMRIPNFGRRSLAEVLGLLDGYGIRLHHGR